jgi:ABC-type multidrug transport system ATPase subunit
LRVAAIGDGYGDRKALSDVSFEVVPGRAEIARVLLTAPRLLLPDEPTVGLDISTRLSLVAFLHRVAAEENIAILWAARLSDEVANGDDLIILAKGQKCNRCLQHEM